MYDSFLKRSVLKEGMVSRKGLLGEERWVKSQQSSKSCAGNATVATLSMSQPLQQLLACAGLGGEKKRPPLLLLRVLPIVVVPVESSPLASSLFATALRRKSAEDQDLRRPAEDRMPGQD